MGEGQMLRLESVARDNRVEKINDDIVGGLVDRIGKRFNAPESSVNRGITTQAFRVDEATLNEYYVNYLLYLGLDQKIVEENTDIRLKLNGHGIAMKLEDGSNIVFIKNDLGDKEGEILEHEIVHSMGLIENGVSGFSEQGFDDKLNEAVVQMAVLMERNTDVTVLELRDRIAAGEIETIYANEVFGLYNAILATEQGDSPLSFEYITDKYFDDTYEPRLKSMAVRSAFNTRIPEKDLSGNNLRQMAMNVYDRLF